MTWGNPPKFVPTKPKKAPKLITPEQLAATGTEDGHQAALFCWAALSVGKYPQLAWLYAVPNGGSRHMVEAIKMVGTGTRKGVPDVFLPHPRAKFNYEFHGCYIELKIEKRRKEKNGGCSDEQLEWIDYLKSAGYYVAVCYGWKEASDTLVSYLEGKL
jgi:hypothetical protein